MLTKDQKSELRSHLFRQLEGFPITGTMTILGQHGLLKTFEDHSNQRLNQLTETFKANDGYLNVALRLLASQGWLIPKIIDDGSDVEYQVTTLGKEAFENWKLYEPFHFVQSAAILLQSNKSYAEHLSWLDEWSRINQQLQPLPDHLSEAFSLQIQHHRMGVLAGPLLVFLGMNNCFNDECSHIDLTVFPEFKNALIAAWKMMNWSNESSDHAIKLNEEGMFYAKRAAAYGVTVSYNQTFCWLNDLIFGKGNKLWDKPLDTPEIHVDRTMNVWGSGGAHGTYFKKVDEIVIEIFNRPIENQPKGIADMGCGNGALLAHLYEVIKTQTLRGKQLEEYPLLVIGADFNELAIESSHAYLKEAGIEACLVKGDIGDPDSFSSQLKSKYNYSLENMLNVRSFLDHNRIFKDPKNHVHGTKYGTGAFAFRGKRLSNFLVEENLREHILGWKPYISKFGLLLIELHTISPEKAAQNPGKTAITAYDGTHGYTDQYIVELDVFENVLKDVGLKLHAEHRAKFPPNDLATVSVNLVTADD